MPPHPSAADGVRLVSGDAVELDIRLARLGSRALARLIDTVVQIVIVLVLLVTAASVVLQWLGPRHAALADVAYVLLLVIVVIGYPTVLETLTGGRTVGKVAMGLRVIRDDGGPVRFRHALTRALIGAAVEWPALGTVVLEPVGWLVCLWVMLANPYGKRLGDLAAGTLVIHERSPATWGWVPAMPPYLAGWAATLDLTGLDDDLALAVRHYLARNRALREPARTRLGYALAGDVAECTTPPAPPGTPGWAYLAAVIAERHRRSALRLAAVRAVTARIWPDLSRAVRWPAPVALAPPPPPPAGPPPGGLAPGAVAAGGVAPGAVAAGPATVRPSTPVDVAR